MPGHKGRVSFDFSFEDDLTELIGADNLLDPKDALKASQEAIAKAYRTARSVLVPAGSTAGIKIALYLATSPGDTLLIQRNAHIALFHAAVAFDLDFRYLPTEIDPATGLDCGLTADVLARALDEHPEVRGVFLTSPDYFGAILPLEELAEVARARGKVLIVDEAHGAHLAFTSLSAYSAVNIADYTVQSLHKTAPALTGSALFHAREPIDSKRLLKGMRLILTTSPSYLTMLASEYAVASMEADWDEARVREMRRKIEDGVPQIEVVKDRGKGFVAYDPSKFLFRIPGRRGDEVAEMLAEEGVYLEMGDAYYALAILSPYNDDEDVSRLIRALRKIEPRKERALIYRKNEKFPERALRPREAFFKETERVALKEAAGRIAAENITPYPPGIPLAVYGERLSEGILSRIIAYGEVIGIEDGTVAVVKEDL